MSQPYPFRNVLAQYPISCRLRNPQRHCWNSWVEPHCLVENGHHKLETLHTVKIDLVFMVESRPDFLCQSSKDTRMSPQVISGS